jgi:uncharacterized membrane protein
MTPADWQRLGFTSGRRTYLGNKKVGGVANSDHLTGSAADFTAPLSAVRARFPNARILDEGDHRHVSGLSDVPYHGKRGTIGLVNGVDTTAPKGTAMIRPRKPQPKAAAMQQPVPMPMQDEPLGVLSAPMPQIAPTPSLAEAPAAIEPGKGGIFGSGLTGWDILGSVADGYLLANGQQGAYTQGKRQEREMQFDREKFNQELEARRQAALAKAAEPPQEFQTADYYNRLPEAQRNAFLQARDAISPIVADIAQPDGSVRRSIIPRGGMAQAGPQPGAEEDGYVFMGGDPADPKNWKAR